MSKKAVLGFNVIPCDHSVRDAVVFRGNEVVFREPEGFLHGKLREETRQRIIEACGSLDGLKIIAGRYSRDVLNLGS